MCSGRGVLDDVGFCATPWDEVAAGLWVGGTVLAAADRRPVQVVVDDRFDLVVSLREVAGHGPASGVEHRTLPLIDGPLDGQDVAALDELVEHVARRWADGASVLVRCHAGLNRAPLVACLVLIRSGWLPQQALDAVRSARSPVALFNDSFEAYVRSRRPPGSASS